MEPLTMAALGYGLANTVWNVGSTIYNAYQGRRQEDREDNAIQRRVEDLKKAGLSPTLAAGSAAASVASPRMEGVSPFGSWIDASNALEQLKQNREMTEQAKLQTKEMKYSLEDANRRNVMNQLAFDWQMGIPFSSVSRNGDGWFNSYGDLNDYWQNDRYTFALDKSPIVQQLRNGLAMDNLSRDMAEKEDSWYNFNQGLNAVSTGVGLGLNAFSTFGGHALKRRALDDSFQQFQQELTRKRNYDNWRMSPHSSYYSDNRGYRSRRDNY